MKAIKLPPHVQAFIDSIKDVPFFKPQGPPRPEWKVFHASTLNAVLNAAYAAALDAVPNAAWDAALLAACLLMQDKIDAKHLEHAKARWEVWQRGYGLYCDVGGVLYVYAAMNGLEIARMRIGEKKGESDV